MAPSTESPRHCGPRRGGVTARRWDWLYHLQTVADAVAFTEGLGRQAGHGAAKVALDADIDINDKITRLERRARGAIEVASGRTFKGLGQATRILRVSRDSSRLAKRLNTLHDAAGCVRHFTSPQAEEEFIGDLGQFCSDLACGKGAYRLDTVSEADRDSASEPSTSATSELDGATTEVEPPTLITTC